MAQALAPRAPAALSTRPRKGKARAHSRFVHFLRIFLPLLMVAVIGALAGLVINHAMRREAAANKDGVTPIRMTNPHFFGRDDKGRAYTLGAHQAARDEKSFQTVLLQYPSLTLDVGGPHPSTITADTGVYHEDTRMLLLRGHVRADNAQSSRFATNEALVNTRTGIVTGPAALSSQSAAGNLQSNSFDVFHKGDTMVFKGRVHARLNGH